MFTYSEKKQEKFAKEMERNLHSAMTKAQGAPRSELAAIQLHEAKKLLKDTELAGSLTPKNHTPEYKSDVAPDIAEKHFNHVTQEFEKELSKHEHLNPEKAERIRDQYGLRKGKSWTVGIDLKKNKTSNS